MLIVSSQLCGVAGGRGGFWRRSEPSRHLLTAGMLAQTRGTVPEPLLVAPLSAAP